MPKNWKGDPFGFFNIHSVAKHLKIEGGDFYFRKKNLSAEKNWKGGPFGIFQHPYWRKTAKNWKGKNFRKKVSQCRKKLKGGDPLVSPGMVCYAEKQEKPFWFSSLGQIVQFGAIIFCRTFNNYFGQFVWIEKKSLIVAFHSMKRLLKRDGKFVLWLDTPSRLLRAPPGGSSSKPAAIPVMRRRSVSLRSCI